MKTTEHKIGLIAKKCAQIRNLGFEVLFEYAGYVDKIEVTISRDITKDVIYSASAYTDGHCNFSQNASSFDEILDSLDAILIGVGIE